MGPAFCVDGSIPGRSGSKITHSTNASPAAGRPLSGGLHGAGVGRLRGGFGLSVEPARDIDDPTRPTSDGFAGARGGAAEGAAEEGSGGAHEVEPGIKVEVEPIEDGREVGGNGSALAAADNAAGLVDQGVNEPEPLRS